MKMRYYGLALVSGKYSGVAHVPGLAVVLCILALQSAFSSPNLSPFNFKLLTVNSNVFSLVSCCPVPNPFRIRRVEKPWSQIKSC
jgi:hypothetical protein